MFKSHSNLPFVSTKHNLLTVSLITSVHNQFGFLCHWSKTRSSWHASPSPPSSGSCLWSFSPLSFGSGMDCPCQPPQILSTAVSSRRGSSRSGPSARRWLVSPTAEELSRARNSIYSKNASSDVRVAQRPVSLFTKGLLPVPPAAASPHRRVYPTWSCATTASLWPKPSASWKTYAGNSQHASVPPLWLWQIGRIPFWNLVSLQKKLLYFRCLCPTVQTRVKLKKDVLNLILKKHSF